MPSQEVRSVNMRQEVHPGVLVDTEIAHGKPTIAGTRIPVVVILGALAAGDTMETLCEEYELTPEQAHAAVDYAIELVNRTAVRPEAWDAEFEAAFEEEFDPDSPGMRYLQDR